MKEKKIGKGSNMPLKNSKNGFRGFVFLTTLLALASGCSTIRPNMTAKRALLQLDEKGYFLKTPEDSDNVVDSYAERGPTSFIWPVQSASVSSGFGKRRRDFHEGIDIRGNRGAPILAARAGKVIYSSRKIRGYGNMIVIRHDGDFSTVYAHNKSNTVRVGDVVEQGDVIGYVGSTGKSTGPHVHFEVRKGEVAVDPLNYLPEGAVVSSGEPNRGPSSISSIQKRRVYRRR